MKSILITGYKGMIGSRLYAYLSALNLYNIHGIDIVDGSGDIRNITYNRHYDLIIHLASLTSVTESIKNPIEYYRTNVEGTARLISQFPNSKFIFSSTSAIYGEGLSHKESDPVSPMVPYADNKLLAELLLGKHSDKNLLLRFANIYGGKKGERNVYQIFEEEDILPIFGDGSSLRDYLHVDNLCPIIHRGFDKSGLYNIGSGILKTVLDIANEFPNKELKYLPERPGEINKISMDLTKAKKDGLII